MFFETFRTARIVLLTTAAALALGACSPPFHRTSDLGSYNVLAVDATQRLVITGTRNEVLRDDDGNIVYNSLGQPTIYQQQVVCTEPSPDALVATAASFESSFTNSTEERAQVASGVREAISNIGVRTQTIQLLRDGYFRVCEAYLNGAIGTESYFLVIRAIDRFMVTLVAIEAISGAPINISLPTIAPANIQLGEGADAAAAAQIEQSNERLAGAIDALSAQLATIAANRSATTTEADAITNIVAQYFALLQQLNMD